MHCIGSVVGVLCVRRAESSFQHQLLDDLAGHRNHSHPTRDLQRPTGGQMFPVSYNNVIIALIFIGIVAFGTVEGCIISRMDEHANPNLDYVVVLGAQVRKSSPSKVLRYRLDTAIDYLNENPGTICIVSGGKGPNEPVAEAQGMTNYLESYGIKKNRIIKEMKSKTTQEKHLE